MPAVVWLTNLPPAFKAAKTKRGAEGSAAVPGRGCRRGPREATSIPQHPSQEDRNIGSSAVPGRGCHLPAGREHGSPGKGQESHQAADGPPAGAPGRSPGEDAEEDGQRGANHSTELPRGSRGRRWSGLPGGLAPAAVCVGAGSRQARSPPRRSPQEPSAPHRRVPTAPPLTPASRPSRLRHPQPPSRDSRLRWHVSPGPGSRLEHTDTLGLAPAVTRLRCGTPARRARCPERAPSPGGNPSPLLGRHHRKPPETPRPAPKLPSLPKLAGIPLPPH